MQHVKAMQYYRLWIYACNCVLLASVLFFVGVGSYVFGDSRMSLITGVRYYHPTFLYAYVAIVLQGGVVQVIGCVGALRLNERLLCIYWLLLLGLLVGDVVVGVIWVFSFQNIVSSLPDELSTRLATEYSADPYFTNVWDLVQRTEKCCGLRSPRDFSTSLWAERFALPLSSDDILKLPSSCCRGNILVNNKAKTTTLPRDEMPQRFEYKTLRPVVKAFRKRKWGRPGVYVQRPPPSLRLPTTTEPPPFNGTCIDNDKPNTVFGRGCLRQLLHWYKGRADILFILGYCVITFLKLCFIGLLRYEIREMIQKMRLLRAEMASAAVNSSGAVQTKHDTSVHSHISHKTNSGGGGLLGKISKKKNQPRWHLLRQNEVDTNARGELMGRTTVVADAAAEANRSSFDTAAICLDAQRNDGENRVAYEVHELNELHTSKQTDI